MLDRLRSVVMFDPDEGPRDLARLIVPGAGVLRATGHLAEPYRLLDADGMPVEAAAVYFRDLLAGGRSPATVRSYGLDLLRWFRFTWAVGVPWQRATRVEGRDFSRWMQLAPRLARVHWRKRTDLAGDAVPQAAGRAYAASVRVHSETVLRGFYDFHLGEGSGPVINPFPLDRSWPGNRAQAHHNPMERSCPELGRGRPDWPWGGKAFPQDICLAGVGLGV